MKSIVRKAVTVAPCARGLVQAPAPSLAYKYSSLFQSAHVSCDKNILPQMPASPELHAQGYCDCQPITTLTRPQGARRPSRPSTSASSSFKPCAHEGRDRPSAASTRCRTSFNPRAHEGRDCLIMQNTAFLSNNIRFSKIATLSEAQFRAFRHGILREPPEWIVIAWGSRNPIPSRVHSKEEAASNVWNRHSAPPL